jgi:thiamine-monophosphate kinase
VDERGRIALLARVLGTGAPGVAVGIGDDAAVLAPPGAPAQLVWTIDEQVEGVHFRRDLLTWRDVGWRSTMAAASDVAAMGGRPWVALAALVLPDDFDDAALAELARGQGEAAAALGAAIVGGNLARGPAVSLATTFLGTAERAVLRRGATAGDGVWLAGRVGLAAAGLSALQAGSADPRVGPAVEAWCRPRALVDAAGPLALGASAACDVSDGLARDADHVAEASEVRLVLDEDAILQDGELAQAAAAVGAPALQLALYGGEDYALLATAPGPIAGFRRIGDVTPGRGIALRGASGERTIDPGGYDHFAPRAPRARRGRS